MSSFFALFCSFLPPGAFFCITGVSLKRFFSIHEHCLFFCVFFFVFGAARVAQGRQISPDPRYCRQKTRFRKNLKNTFLRPFGHPLGPLLVSFCTLLDSLGRSWAPLGVPKGAKSRKKERKNEVLNLGRHPKGPKGRPKCPRTSKREPQGSKKEP